MAPSHEEKGVPWWSSLEAQLVMTLEAIPLFRWESFCRNNNLELRVRMDREGNLVTQVLKKDAKILENTKKLKELPGSVQVLFQSWRDRLQQGSLELGPAADIAEGLITTASTRESEVMADWDRLKELALFCRAHNKGPVMYIRDRELFQSIEQELDQVRLGARKIEEIGQRTVRASDPAHVIAQIQLSQIQSRHPLGQVVRLARLIHCVPVPFYQNRVSPEGKQRKDVSLRDPLSCLWLERSFLANFAKTQLYTHLNPSSGIFQDVEIPKGLTYSPSQEESVKRTHYELVLDRVEVGVLSDITALQKRIRDGLEHLAKDIGYYSSPPSATGSETPYR